MTLEQTIQRIHTIADQLLVNFAEDRESRFLFTLPPISEEASWVPVLDCQEYNYGIARLREALAYKYLLGAMKHKQLAVSKESLAACLRNMRRVPFIDYYDLGDYHEYAHAYYKQLGDEKKARRHLLCCYMDRGRAILSCDKIFDCKELIMALMKEHRRMQAFLVYVISFIHYDFEEVQELMKRSQYLLLERALVLAVKLFAENGAYDADVRSCIYYVQSVYYERTNREELAKSAREAYKKVGGSKNFDLTLVKFMMDQPDPQLMDEQFLDYLLYGDSVDEEEIYPHNEEGEIDLDLEAEDPVVVKDGRSNFMDTFCRVMPDAMEFRKMYGQAEKGDEGAIREVVRCYREGDRVSVCECAAAAWEQLLSNK